MYDLTGFQRDLLYVIAGKKNPRARYQRRTRRLLREGDPPRPTVSQPRHARGQGSRGEGPARPPDELLQHDPPGSREIEARRDWENQYVETEGVVAVRPRHPSTRAVLCQLISRRTDVVRRYSVTGRRPGRGNVGGPDVVGSGSSGPSATTCVGSTEYGSIGVPASSSGGRS